MMTYKDEQLSAYLDGELSDQASSALETALNEDAELAQRLEQLSMATKEVKAVFDPIVDEPIPDHILSLFDTDRSAGNPDTQPDTIIPWPANQSSRTFSRWAMPLAASIALVIGLTIGNGMGRDSHQESLLAQVSGTISMDNPVFQVLEHTPSATSIELAGKGGVVVRPLLTFQAQNGSYCREFEVQGNASGVHGVACRNDKVWRIEILNRAAHHGRGGLRTATGASDEVIDQFIADTISDIPYGIEAEADIMKQGWKK